MSSFEVSLKKMFDSVKGDVVEGLKNQNGDVKSIKDVSVFTTKNGKVEYNENLLTKDGFIESLYDSNEKDDKKKVSKEELAAIYDAVAALDGDDKMSAEELWILSSADNSKGKITTSDLKALVKNHDKKASDKDKTKDVKNDKETIKAKFKKDDRIKTESDGKRSVTVENWSSDGKNNGSLNAIIKNSYDLDAMGIKPGSEEYKALEKAVMDANPSIFGNESGGWRQEVGGSGRASAVLHTGDKIILPDFETKTKPAETNSNQTNKPAQSSGGETPKSNITPAAAKTTGNGGNSGNTVTNNAPTEADVAKRKKELGISPNTQFGSANHHQADLKEQADKAVETVQEPPSSETFTHVDADAVRENGVAKQLEEAQNKNKASETADKLAEKTKLGKNLSEARNEAWNARISSAWTGFKASLFGGDTEAVKAAQDKVKEADKALNKAQDAYNNV